jgi:phosphoribosylanthranilate isomerase
VAELLRDGAVDAIQFHGEESPQECESHAFPYYRAIRLGSTADAEQISAYGCPRVLVDARTRAAYGGTGKRLSEELVATAAKYGPLWIAGGINDENIAEIMRAFRPELVDASSGLEREPGRKDHARLRRFFAEVQRETSNA